MSSYVGKRILLYFRLRNYLLIRKDPLSYNILQETLFVVVSCGGHLLFITNP